MSEYSRRLAIAIEAERNQAEASGRVPDLGRAQRQVLEELGLEQDPLARLVPAELIAQVERGLAGNASAKAALAYLLQAFDARLAFLERSAWLSPEEESKVRAPS